MEFWSSYKPYKYWNGLKWIILKSKTLRVGGGMSEEDKLDMNGKEALFLIS